MITQNKTAMELIPPHIYPWVERCALVGSRVTCKPPVMDTDCDVLVLLRQEPETIEGVNFNNVYAPLVGLGFELGGSGEGEDKFESWTFEELNLILTCDREFYDRFLAATTVAARLNLMDKADRKALFRAVLYSECCGYIAEGTTTAEEPSPW